MNSLQNNCHIVCTKLNALNLTPITSNNKQCKNYEIKKCEKKIILLCVAIFQYAKWDVMSLT